MKALLPYVAVAAAAVAAVAILARFGRAAVTAAVPYVNPADERNLANQAVSSIGAAITGDDSWSLGGQLAEWFDPATRAVNRMNRMRESPPAKSAYGQMPSYATTTDHEAPTPFDIIAP